MLRLSGNARLFSPRGLGGRARAPGVMCRTSAKAIAETGTAHVSWILRLAQPTLLGGIRNQHTTVFRNS